MEESLARFLDINEKLPEYKTKNRKHQNTKSSIGTLQGAHDSMTGIVDIAMAGLLCARKGSIIRCWNGMG